MNEQQPAPLRIAIVGGGISGLSAAHRLAEIAPTCRVTLFDAGERPGGVLSTVHEQGYQVEQSADNFITTVPWGVGLCQRIGLGDELIQTNPTHRHTFVVHKGRLCRLPDGFLMMAPTRMWPLAVTPILSPLGKLRAAMEYFIPVRQGDGDESMAAFARRRLGREVFDRLIEPLVSAVYAADMEKLSLDATLSQFREMEIKQRQPDPCDAASHGHVESRKQRQWGSLQHVRHAAARPIEHDRCHRCPAAPRAHCARARRLNVLFGARTARGRSRDPGWVHRRSTA